MDEKSITGSQGSKKEKIYYKELFYVCNYMIQNQEKFKDFVLLQEAYEEGAAAIDLYQKLIAQYRFLIGEEKCTEAMPSLDVSKMNTDDLAEILVTFHHFTNEGGRRIDLKGNLRRVDIEKNAKLLSYLIEKIAPCDEVPGKNMSRKEILDGSYNVMRYSIVCMLPDKQDAGVKYMESVKELGKLLYRNNSDDSVMKLMYKNNAFCRELRPYCDVWLYVDLCCREILQYVIQGIIRNRNNLHKTESIKELNRTVLNLIAKEKIQKATLKGTVYEIMFKFYSFFYIKDKFFQDTDVLKIITDHTEKTVKLDINYSLFHYVLEEDKFGWSEMQRLFNEDGKMENLKTFKSNLLKCYHGIHLFNRKTNRNISINPVSLKVFYREIYKDKTKYNGRQSKTIFNDFLESGNLGTADYYFIDEKINMGMFREYGLISEFYEKNKLQENLYNLVLLILAKLEPSEIEEAFHRALKIITNKICRISAVHSEKNTEQTDILEETDDYISVKNIEQTDILEEMDDYISVKGNIYEQEDMTSDQLLKYIWNWFKIYEIVY